jgi:stage II sporulation protein D
VPACEDAQPPLVRVLVRAGGQQPAFPEAGRRFVAVAGGQPTLVRGPLTLGVEGGRAAIQIGAYAQEGNAAGALVRLQATGFDGRIVLSNELWRVLALARLGEDAAALAVRLRSAGFADQSRTAAGVDGSVVVAGEAGVAVRAPVIRLVALDGTPVRVGAKALRGEFEVRATVAGPAIIDVINLEKYLRGVVPAEMGPHTFGALEALKAQAVAARTYAVAHLGDHAFEGYDLCDTPACQAYEGASAEQPLSDEAVRATAGEVVLYAGKPIDALYHSTCAGHTEDGGALFPERAAPYLRGVACRGERMVELAGTAAAGPWRGALEHLALVAERIASGLGVAASADALTRRLTGGQPGKGLTGLAQAFGVGESTRALGVAPDDVGDEAVVALLQLYRLPLPLERGAGRKERELAAVIRLGQLSGRVQAITGRLVPGPRGPALAAEGASAPRDLGALTAVLERRGERWRVARLRAPAGSPATLWCVEELCPVLEVEALAQADAGSSWGWWVRELSLDEISQRLGLKGVTRIEVMRRGVSGRALAVRVGAGAETCELGGLAFRRALDLPDTLFVVLAARKEGRDAIRFLGRGWGHGVGMCQNGAYGLARGGADYHEILSTYYTGVTFGPWNGGRP